jgi:hypothetical protein
MPSPYCLVTNGHKIRPDAVGGGKRGGGEGEGRGRRGGGEAKTRSPGE